MFSWPGAEGEQFLNEHMGTRFFGLIPHAPFAQFLQSSDFSLLDLRELTRSTNHSQPHCQFPLVFLLRVIRVGVLTRPCAAIVQLGKKL